MGTKAERGWLLLDPRAVPKRWRERAIPVALVPLLPREAEQVLGGQEALPELDPQDERLARLAARGLSVPVIAAEVGISPRSVQRRLAELRRRLGVGSKVELVRALSKRGF